MSAVTAARSLLRSSATRTASGAVRAAALASKSRPARCPFRISGEKPVPARTFRWPVELSSCVESMLPYHTATASALLTSMLSVSRRTHGWTPEDSNDDV